MKSIVILYNDDYSKYAGEKAFNNKSALELSHEWAASFADEVVEISSGELKDLTVHSLLEKLCQVMREKSGQRLIFSYSDLPFLNKALTEEILDTHEKYDAEYTFQDGYPYGFAPEVIEKQTLEILLKLSESTYAENAKAKISRTCIFDFMKSDINSFEVETVLADEDWRLFRFSFDVSNLNNFNSCKNLFEKINGKNLSVNEISREASVTPEILKSLPAYYNIQISEKTSSNCIYFPEEMASPASESFMPVEKFGSLVKKISEFSETAVVSLSAFGEPLLHPDFEKIVELVLAEKALHLLIETDGINVTEELCEKISQIEKNAPNADDGFSYFDRILWVVKVDASTKETYSKIFEKEENFEKALNAVCLLEKYFEGKVYPQFTRMNENEEELEAFYRFWNAKTSPSKGQLIIQKYQNYCGKLPERKPCDLSPVERNVCWHLRRDMTVLQDGSVPLCLQMLKSKIAGNAFSENLSDIWKNFDDELKNHMKNNYCSMCGKCDDYYTFNF